MAKSTKKKSKNRQAVQPRVELDMKLLRLLAEDGCSIDEIVAMLRRCGATVGRETVKRRLAEPAYREAWEDGVMAGKAMLRSNMMKQAKMMNSAGVSMAQHLSRTYLGMNDKVEHSGHVEVEVRIARDTLAAKLETLYQRINGGEGGVLIEARPAKVAVEP